MNKNNLNETIEQDETNEINNPDICPICNQLYIASCKCIRNERVCANNHWWHICSVHRKSVIGKADHAVSMKICTCKKEE